MTLPKVYINAQSIHLDVEAYENYMPRELFKNYLHSNPRLYIKTNMGWKEESLDKPLRIPDEMVVKLVGKESFIKTNETTLEIVGNDTIKPEIQIHTENIVLQGGDNLKNHLDFKVMDYRYGLYDYELKKPDINFVATEPGNFQYTIVAQDLSGNTVEKVVQFQVEVKELSLDESDNDNVWLNPAIKLPQSFKPELVAIPSAYVYQAKNLELRPQALDAFMQMLEAMQEVNMSIQIEEAYTAYDTLSDDNRDFPQGHSEHQTGLALDIRDKTQTHEDFLSSDTYQWVLENAHEYGFIIRYPQNKESITHYSANDFHLRYVGKNTASYIYNNDMTFDEYIIQSLD